LCYEELDIFSGKLETSPAALKPFMSGAKKNLAFFLGICSNFVTFGS
jgi:hypothetical protein